MHDFPKYYFELLGSEVSNELFLCWECNDLPMVVCFDQLSHETWVQQSTELTGDGMLDAQ